MSKNHERFKVFHLADALVVEIYARTAGFPATERYGLQSQIRRAAVSVPTNIVEGAARRTSKELAQFISIALGSASEVNYLVGLAFRLKLISEFDHDALGPACQSLVRALQGFLDAIR